MAVSNTLGSNVFDVLIGLALPWFVQTAMVAPGTTVRKRIFRSYARPYKCDIIEVQGLFVDEPRSPLDRFVLRTTFTKWAVLDLKDRLFEKKKTVLHEYIIFCLQVHINSNGIVFSVVLLFLTVIITVSESNPH